MRTSKIQKRRQGAPKSPMGSGKGFNPKFLGILNNFFDPSAPSMRKEDNRVEKTGGKHENRRENNVGNSGH